MEQPQVNAERRSSMALLPGIVDRPRQTFTALLAAPRWRWVLPLVLCILALALVSAATADFASEQARQQQAQAMSQMQAQLDSMPEAQREQTQRLLDRTTSPVFVGGISFITRGLGLPIAWLIGTAILYFGLAIGGTELKFSALFSAFSWTWLPFALRDFLQAVWTLATDQPLRNPGLSYFVATGDLLADSRNPVYASDKLTRPVFRVAYRFGLFPDQSGQAAWGRLRPDRGLYAALSAASISPRPAILTPGVQSGEIALSDCDARHCGAVFSGVS